jgi:hypothetical protein
MTHHDRHVAHPFGLEGLGEAFQRGLGNFEEIIPQGEVFDGIPRQGKLSRHHQLRALVVCCARQVEKIPSVLAAIAHGGVGLGKSQAKTGHTQ